MIVPWTGGRKGGGCGVRVRGGGAGLLPLVVPALLVVLTACGGATVRDGVGGLAPGQAERISVIVAQTRAQFPELSGTELPFEVRIRAVEEPAPQPTLALRGAGRGVEPGLQAGDPPRIEAALYLVRPGYAQGHLLVTPAGGSPEPWAIVAYDRLGTADATFDFTYVLVTPAGAVRYLTVIGGSYEADGASYLGYEGTLIVPGPDAALESWERAYKLDFGYRFPAVPAYRAKVDEAVDVLHRLESHLAQLDRIRERTAEAEGRVVALRAVPAGQEPERVERELAAAQDALAQQAERRAARLELTQADFLRYYALRTQIAGDYAAFVAGNRYLWAELEARQDFYAAWQVVEFHHPRIDALVTDYLSLTEEAGPVLEARRNAMDVITRHNNWDKHPTPPTRDKPR